MSIAGMIMRKVTAEMSSEGVMAGVGVVEVNLCVFTFISPSTANTRLPPRDPSHGRWSERVTTKHLVRLDKQHPRGVH